MALPPCHALFQFYTAELTLEERLALFAHDAACEPLTAKGDPDDVHAVLDRANVPRRYLDCQLYQRSADIFLGVPFNIASYALLTALIGHVVNMVPRYFVHTFGDLHLYSNHVEQAKLQLSRDLRPLPKLHLTCNTKDITAIKYEDIVIEGYDPHPSISAPVAV